MAGVSDHGRIRYDAFNVLLEMGDVHGDELGKRNSYLHTVPVRIPLLATEVTRARLREGGMLQVNACLARFFASHVTLLCYAYFLMYPWCPTLRCN
jgi:hypothetical protein